MIATVNRQQRTMDQDMAKKRAEEQIDSAAASSRKQKLNVTALQRQVGICRELLAKIDAVLEEARQAKITEFEIDGATKLRQSAVILSSFSSHIASGLQKAKFDRVFDTEEPETQ